MTETSADILSVSRRLWSRATKHSGSNGDHATAVERLFDVLRGGLIPWTGEQGYRALLSNAVRVVEEQHPRLDALSFLTQTQPLSVATAESDSGHAIESMEASTVALVSALISAFGRYVGASMAVRLIDQIDVSPAPHRQPPNLLARRQAISAVHVTFSGSADRRPA